jgi:hypothetical protein
VAERELATITYENGYQGLIDAFRARSNELQIALSGPSVAQVSGLASHYILKVLSPSPAPRRRFGAVSLAPILGTLGLKLIVVEDEKAMQRFTSKLEKRQENCVHNNGMQSVAVHVALSRRFVRQIGRKGGLNSRKYMSSREARALARHAALERWRKVAEKEAAAEARKAAKRKAPAREDSPNRSMR